MRRPGGQSPAIQPMSITMFGSLIVIQWRQEGARAGTMRATWRAKTSGEPGRSQNSSPCQTGWVKWCSVTIGAMPRAAHMERISA